MSASTSASTSTSTSTARQSSRDKTSKTITEFYSDSPEARSRRSSIAEEESEPKREAALVKVPTVLTTFDDSPRVANYSETSFDLQSAREKQQKSVVKQKPLSIDLFPETSYAMSSSRMQFNTQRLSIASRRSNSTAMVTAPNESAFPTPACSPCVAAPPKVHVQTLALPVSQNSLYFAFPAFSSQSRFTAKNRNGQNQLTHRERSFANVQPSPTPEHAANSRTTTTIFDGRKLPTRAPTTRSSSLLAGYSSRRLLNILLQQQMDLQQREEEQLLARKRSNVEISLLGRPVGTPRSNENFHPLHRVK